MAAIALLLLAALPARRGAAEGAPAATPAADRARTAEARRAVLRNPLLWSLGAAYFFMKLIRYVLLFWLPYYMEGVLHYSPTAAGNVPLAFEAGGAIGALTIGYISDRLGSRRAPVAIASLVGLAAALPLWAHVAPLGLGANIAGLAATGFFGPDALLSGAGALVSALILLPFWRRR